MLGSTTSPAHYPGAASANASRVAPEPDATTGDPRAIERRRSSFELAMQGARRLSGKAAMASAGHGQRGHQLKIAGASILVLLWVSFLVQIGSWARSYLPS